MVNKKVRSRNCNCAYLMQTEDRKPELIVTLENKHNSVALLDTERLEVVSRLSRMFFNILECEDSFCLVTVNMNKSTLIG